MCVYMNWAIAYLFDFLAMCVVIEYYGSLINSY